MSVMGWLQRKVWERVGLPSPRVYEEIQAERMARANRTLHIIELIREKDELDHRMVLAHARAKRQRRGDGSR